MFLRFINIAKKRKKNLKEEMKKVKILAEKSRQKELERININLRKGFFLKIIILIIVRMSFFKLIHEAKENN